MHFFFECTVVRKIWNQVETFLNETFDLQVHFTLCTIVLNQILDVPCNIADFICLLVKVYLYQCRCKRNQPNFYEIEGYIAKCHLYERHHAYKTDKIKIHSKKWSQYKVKTNDV